MTTLYITRHGQTEENLRRILQGQMPGHLTREGILQAEELRERLRDVPFRRIFTSDLKRAVDTARIIAAPHTCPFTEEPLLRERDFGKHTGGPYISISRALDPSAETMENLSRRAAEFLTRVAADKGLRECDVLVVSHGLFLRVLQAVFHNVPVREVGKMENAEVRRLVLHPGMVFTSDLRQEEAGGTAN
ncbi:MAG: histidine phosphatase family protein [Bacteroidaceae bacterium]|nr:histidine phosphatase family protein [Bacteroidaceae bacterium]